MSNRGQPDVRNPTPPSVQPARSLAALTVFVLLAVGCEEALIPAPRWHTPRVGLTLLIDGPEATLGKRETCGQIFALQGVELVPGASTRVWLHLESGRNHLQISSDSRGVMVNEPREGWSMAELCADAYARLVEAMDKRPETTAVAPAQAGAADTPAPPTTAPAPAARPKRNPRWGTLTVRSIPAGAQLFIDGETAAQWALELRPGVHSIVVEWPDGHWAGTLARVGARSERIVELREGP